MSDLEAKDLRLVKAIAEEGGVTQAARRLHLSQSAVSHQLSNLEDRLGVPLFDRVRKRMEITRAGLRLRALADELLPRLALAQAELAGELGAQRPPLRLSTQCYTCYHWFPQVAQHLAAEHPGLEIQLVAEATRAPIEAMLEDRLDAALCCFPVRDRRLTGVPLFDDELVVVMPALHPLARRSFVTAEELLRERVYFYELPEADERRLNRQLFPKSAPHARLIKLPLTEAIIEFVRAGQGLTLLSRWSLGPYLERGDLVTRPFGRSGMRRTWQLVWPKRTKFEAPITTLATLLRSAMRPDGARPLRKRTASRSGMIIRGRSTA